jgi:hypothetical protein
MRRKERAQRQNCKPILPIDRRNKQAYSLNITMNEADATHAGIKGFVFYGSR